MEEKEIREEVICQPSHLVEACIQDVQEEDVKLENAEIKGRIYVNRYICFVH